MTPEQEAGLQTPIDAIAKMLYKDSDPEKLKTLEGIETRIRAQLQEPVSRQLGAFLSARLQAQRQDKANT